MQANLQRIRPNQATSRATSNVRSLAASFASKEQSRRSSALVCPLAVSNSPPSRSARTQTALCSCKKRWNSRNQLGAWGSLWEAVGRGSLRQNRSARRFSSRNRAYDRERNNSLAELLAEAENELLVDDLSSWKRMFAHMQNEHGADGAWACFELLRERHRLHIILSEDGDGLRDEIIKAAVDQDARVQTLLDVVLRLESFSQTWPDFYARVVASFLEKGYYERALQWHNDLSKRFPPGSEVIGRLLSTFITDPRPEMQSTLTEIYVSSGSTELYDRIIPFLFELGHSQLARAWRKKLIRLGDYPSSPRVRPFLDFVAQYYPEIEITSQELEFAGRPTAPVGRPSYRKEANRESTSYSDSFVAKWFASSWWPVEHAIHSVHMFGYQTMGARSLQAMALRDPDPTVVTSRLSLLERLKISIAPRTYSKALVFFARNGDAKLLEQLVHTDVHPDEFDDSETRQMIMADAARTRDWEREKLFQAVEWAVENEANPHQLNHMLRNMLSTRQVGKAKVVVDRMEALNVKITQKNAATLLSRVFWGISKHPTNWKRKIPRGSPDQQLDRAIHVVRKLVSHDIAIPLRHWESLIYSLGRLGRFDELLQLSLEILQIFKPPGGGLVPVYRNDVPQESQKIEDDASDFDAWEDESSFRKNLDKQRDKGEMEDTQLIPADLPFTHRQHPVRKLFDAGTQRRIIRWGFDQKLAELPEPTANDQASMNSKLRLSGFDTACGVRILASLRDHGVLIDKQLIRTTIASRIALGQVPSRRHPRRDSHDVAVEHVKHLVDSAWGSEVLPDIPNLHKLVERQRHDIWKRYPMLFKTTYAKRKKRKDVDEEAEDLLANL